MTAAVLANNLWVIIAGLLVFVMTIADVATRQPTMARLKTSMINAGYAKPDQVLT